MTLKVAVPDTATVVGAGCDDIVINGYVPASILEEPAPLIP